MTKTARYRALARPSERVAGADRARARRDHRGDPRGDRPRGARVRAAARGQLRARDPHRRRGGAAQFVALIRDPEGGREPGREVYVALGRGEQRQGRTLDSLQAAYRVGARVAWRRIAAAGAARRARPRGAEPARRGDLRLHRRALRRRGRGYAEAQAEVEDVRRRRRRELVALLVREPPADPADLRGRRPGGRAGAAARASPRWPVREADLAGVARRLAAGVAGDGPRRDGLPADRRSRRARPRARRSSGPRPRPHAGARPAVEPLAALGSSWSLAGAGRCAPQRPARCLRRPAARRGPPRRPAPLRRRPRWPRGSRPAGWRPSTRLTEKAAQRMRRDGAAYVRHGGNAVAMAAELHVHPQTARYRIARLRELLGDQLDDPDARFELEAGAAAVGRRSAAPDPRQGPEDDVPERRGDAEAVAVVLEVVAHVLLAQPLAELGLGHEVVHVVVRVVVDEVAGDEAAEDRVGRRACRRSARRRRRRAPPAGSRPPAASPAAACRWGGRGGCRG